VVSKAGVSKCGLSPKFAQKNIRADLGKVPGGRDPRAKIIVSLVARLFAFVVGWFSGHVDENV